MKARLFPWIVAIGVLLAPLAAGYGQQRGGDPGQGQPGGALPAGAPQGAGGGRGAGGPGNLPPNTPGPPAGVERLAVDLFTPKNSYKDKPSWMANGYCAGNTPRTRRDLSTPQRCGA